MQCMELVVRPWRRTDPAMSADLVGQIWLICALVIGGPLEPKDVKAKGKAKEVVWAEETKMATLSLLLALAEPIASAAAMPGEPLPPAPTSLFSAPNGPSSHANGHARTRSIPLPILAHTLTTLLDLVREAPSANLRDLALTGVHYLVTHHLPRAQSEGGTLLVQSFPGIVSALASLLSTKAGAGKARTTANRAALAAKALEVLGEVIPGVIGDAGCADIVRSRRRDAAHIDRLEDLVVVVEEEGGSEHVAQEAGLRSSAWLAATVSQLHVAILSFAPAVRSHHSSLVRIAYSGLCRTCLVRCADTLEPRTRSALLADLLALACDDWPEVAAAAEADLDTATCPPEELSALLSTAIVALPQTILSHGDDETRMTTAIRLLRGIARARTRSKDAARFGVVIDTERWSFALLHALELTRVPVGSEGPTQGDGATVKAWIGPGRTMLALEADGEAAEAERPYPALAFRRLPSIRIVLALRNMFTELTRASPDLIDHFLALATGGLDPKQRAAAWWLLDAALQALAPATMGAKVSSKLRRATRAVIAAVVELHDAGHENEADVLAAAPSDVASLIPVDHQRGAVDVVSRLNAYAPGGSTEAKQFSARAERLSTGILAASLSLRVLATASAVLGTGFRADLLSTLYPVLAHLGTSTHPLLRGHAEVALARITDHAGYASVENLVLDNVDYVVNAVSQRLTLARLDPQAPLVLVTVIRLVGDAIVPLVQDVIDDVFDALDDFHGYDVLCASLLAILDALVKAMSLDLPDPLELDAKDSGHPLPPDPERDLQTFEAWYAKRQADAARESEDFGPCPPGGFASAALDEKEEEQEPAAEPEAEDSPPTRTQAACIAMLGKALLSLNHDSAFLRARVLSLLAAGVPVLAPDRKVDLLPIVHRAWPYVLHRLSPTESPPVIAEAAALVEVLGRHAGDFMSRRILDDAWPRFRALLAATEDRERTSALRGKTSFTSAQRLYLALLGAMRDVAVGVPLAGELAWELAVAFRRFLVGVSPEEVEVRRRARALYEALRAWHPEVVWLALMGGAGEVELPAFLRVEGMTRECVASLVA
jgi:hypothetical protein